MTFDQDPIRPERFWAKRKQLEAVFADPVWKVKWIDALAKARDAYDPQVMLGWIDAWSAQTRDAALTDPSKPFTNDDYDAALASLRDFIPKRADFMTRWIGCMRGTPGMATDADGDGVPWCQDCNDNDRTVYPGAPEICDGKDNDCNGWVDDNDSCPDCQTHAFGGVNFSFCTSPRTFAQAQARCQSLGGTLGVPTTQTQQAFLTATITNLIPNIAWWIGATNTVTAGTWTTPSGGALSYTSWGDGEPNPDPSANCAVLSNEFGGDWSAQSCDEKKVPAVCRLP
jgi:hypothetical protein